MLHAEPAEDDGKHRRAGSRQPCRRMNRWIRSIHRSTRVILISPVSSATISVVVTASSSLITSR